MICQFFTYNDLLQTSMAKRGVTYFDSLLKERNCFVTILKVKIVLV